MNIHVLCTNCHSFRKTKYSSAFSEDTNISYSKCTGSINAVEKALKKAVTTWRKSDFVLVDNALSRNSDKSFRKLFAGILYRYEKTIQEDPRNTAKKRKLEAKAKGEKDFDREIQYNRKKTHIFSVELNQLIGYTFIYGECKIIVLPKGLKSDDIPAFAEKALALYEENCEVYPEGYSLTEKVYHAPTFREKYFPAKKDSLGENIRKSVQLLAVASFFVAGILLIYNMVYLPMENAHIQSEIQTIFYETETDPKTEKVIKTRNWHKLKAVNEEIVGWIKLDNTVIDYPILQHKGDNEDDQYYLYRNHKKQSSGFGSIFVDYRSKKGLKSKNAILHGHHMDDGSMFSDLMNYGLMTGNLSFYKKTPTIEISTEKGGTETYKIFSVFKSNVDPEQGEYFDFYCGSFDNDAQFMNYVYNLQIRSLITTPVTVNEDDRLLTLVTCSYEFKNFRTVVVARKCRKGESPQVDTGKASIPPTSLWPQIYYSTYGRTRPSVSTFKTEYEKGNIKWYDGNYKLKGEEELPTSVLITHTVKVYDRDKLIKTMEVENGCPAEMPKVTKRFKEGKYQYLFIGWSCEGSKNENEIYDDTTIKAVYSKSKAPDETKATKETKPKPTKPKATKPKPTKPKPTKPATKPTQATTQATESTEAPDQPNATEAEE